MSAEARDHVRKHSRRKGSEFHLLMAIADYADKKGQGWPGIPRLAADLRMSERQVKRLLAKLHRTDELKVKRGAGPRGTNLYQLNMGLSLDLFEATGGDILTPHRKAGGDIPGQKGVTSRVKRGDTAMSPEPRTKTEPAGQRRKGPKRVDKSYAAPAAADLEFPHQTTERQRVALMKLAEKHRLDRAQLQLAFDEVRTRQERREHVGNVFALTDAIAQQIRDGKFYGERAQAQERRRGGGRPLSAAELEHAEKKVA